MAAKPTLPARFEAAPVMAGDGAELVVGATGTTAVVPVETTTGFAEEEATPDVGL